MYTPNFNDPRIQRRCHNALGMAVATLRTDKARPLGVKFIRKYFGQCQKDISKWLKGQLLITHCDLYDYERHYCKQYKLNESGARYVADMLGIDLDINNTESTKRIVVNWAKDNFADQFSGGFEYEDRSHRLWNPLQNIPSEQRQALFAEHGFKHIYDIKTAAPTLLYQLYLKQGGAGLSVIEDYIAHKDVIRDTLALAVGIEPKTAKQVITALFAGACISTNSRHALYRMLDYNDLAIGLLKHNTWLSELITDIRSMWALIKSNERVILAYNTDGSPKLTKTGKHKVETFTSSRKWSIYFREERRVNDLIQTYTALEGIKIFLEHDGFSSNRPVDMQDLSAFIQSEVGYHVDFDYTQIVENTQDAVFEYA